MIKLSKFIQVTAVVVLLGIPHLSAHAAVFFGAHPDDIELFMNRNASTDVYVNSPTVFVLTTAGDGGNGGGGYNSHGTPYYRARLAGHEYALRFWQSLNGQPVAQVSYSRETIAGKSIEKATFGNVVIYNLNLPDGNMDGSGFSTTGSQSLAKLRAGLISQIVSVDNNSYTLAQLKQVILEIIRINNIGTPTVWVNIQDPDGSYNPGDHSDHLTTGQLVLDAIQTTPCINKVMYVDYDSANRPENMTVAEKNIHVGTWGALNSGLVNSGNTNTWEPGHNSWLGRQYMRTSASGIACNF